MKKVIILIILIAVAVIIYSTSGKKEVDTMEVNPGEQLSMIPAGSYMIDTEVSVLEWKANMGVIKSHYGNVVITGGDLSVMEDGSVSGMMNLDMNSITSEVGDSLNGHLKSADFFDVENHPTASLEVTSIEGNMLKGNLTIKGITEPIESEMQIVQDTENAIAIIGNAEFDRSLFDVRYGSASFFNDLGDQVINDIVSISYTVVVTQ